MASFHFVFIDLSSGGDRIRRRQTDDGEGRRVDVTLLLRRSHLWYQLPLHSQLPPLLRPVTSLCMSFSPRWEGRAALRRRNMSPRWTSRLQITAHYLGVTCPVPLKHHRVGRMCVSIHWGVLQPILDLNSQKETIDLVLTRGQILLTTRGLGLHVMI